MFFGGTYGDQNYPDGGQILSRLYATTESSELIIFKGNDIAGGPGPDRIRLRAANICFDTYPGASSDPTPENIQWTITEQGNLNKTGSLTNLSGINLPTGGSGITWGNGYSRIIDDGDLRICTDDNMHFYSGCNSGSLGTERITMLNSGYVGIGVTNPFCPLQVNNGTQLGSNFSRYFNVNSALTAAQYAPYVSFYCSNDIVTGGGSIVSWSDQRTKILEPSPDCYSELVTKIQVRRFSLIDNIEQGDIKKFGFFAQEVEEVVPDAVKKMKGVVPTIYRQATAFTDTTITITKHGIINEKKLNVVDAENGKHTAEIIKVIDQDTLEVKFEKIPKDKLFVVGPEVDDVRAINHDQLMALSFGAVKELIEEMTQLRTRMATFETRLTAAGL
jgi:hypothetical protein